MTTLAEIEAIELKALLYKSKQRAARDHGQNAVARIYRDIAADLMRDADELRKTIMPDTTK